MVPEGLRFGVRRIRYELDGGLLDGRYVGVMKSYTKTINRGFSVKESLPVLVNESRVWYWDLQYEKRRKEVKNIGYVIVSDSGPRVLV